jgi:hypothetical protein
VPVVNGWVGLVTLTIASPPPLEVYGKAGWAEAVRGPDQHLKVVIVTWDEGVDDGGVFGFAYSDDPLKPTHDELAKGDRNLLRLDPPTHVCNSYQRMQIDAHWWEVFAGDR